MGSDWETFARAIVHHMVKDETRQAVAAVAAIRMSSEQPERVGIAEIVRVCKALNARLAPVAACFGWLRSYHSPRAWVNVLKHQGGTGILPGNDPETMCLFAVFRGSCDRIISTLVRMEPGRSMEMFAGDPKALRARRAAKEAEMRQRHADKQATARAALQRIMGRSCARGRCASEDAASDPEPCPTSPRKR